MRPVIAVATQKGGVGKTTTTVNLAGALVNQYQLRVLVIDLDPQCDATALLLGHGATPDATVRDVLWVPRPAGDVMMRSPVHPDLYVVAGSSSLAGDEKHIDASTYDAILQDARQTLVGGVPDAVDLVLIDTPPSLGLWMQCGLAAADAYILMGEPGALGTRGMGQFLDTADHVRTEINPGLTRLGVVINNVRATSGDEAFINMLQGEFLNEVLSVVPQRGAVRDASAEGVPVEFFPGARPELRRCYRELGATVLRRLGLRPRPRTEPAGRGDRGGGGGVAPRRTGAGLVVPHNTPDPSSNVAESSRPVHSSSPHTSEGIHG